MTFPQQTEQANWELFFGPVLKDNSVFVLLDTVSEVL